MSDAPSFLVRTPLLRDLNPAELLDLEPILTEVTVPAGGLVFEEGDEGEACYVIRTGRVGVQRATHQGVSHRLAELEPGGCFGEIALLDG